MGRVLVFISFLAAASISLNAQNLELGINTGIGTFHMGDLREIQDDVYHSLGLPNVRKTSSFPIYGIFGINLNLKNHKSSTSVLFRYESTGSRIAYSDYSGAFTFDQLAHQLVFGVGYKIYVDEGISENQKKPIPFFAISSGVSFSSITFESSTRIDQQSVTDSQVFSEIASFLEPGLGFRFSYGRLNLEPNIVLHIPVYRTGLFLKGDIDAKVEDEDGSIHANWLGLRIGVAVSLQL